MDFILDRISNVKIKIFIWRKNFFENALWINLSKTTARIVYKWEILLKQIYKKIQTISIVIRKNLEARKKNLYWHFGENKTLFKRSKAKYNKINLYRITLCFWQRKICKKSYFHLKATRSIRVIWIRNHFYTPLETGGQF